MSESQPEAGKRRFFSRRGRIVIRVLGATLLSFVLLIFVFRFTLPIEVLFALAMGWLIHGLRVVPDFLLKWQAAVLPVMALGLAWVIGHHMICWWLARLGHKAAEGWSIRRSGAVLGSVMLCGMAAIAISGVAHQLMWLGQTKWMGHNWSERSGTSHLTMKMSNTRQVMMLLYEFEASHGRLPHSWDELLDWDEGEYWENFVQLLRVGRTSVALPVLTLPGAETKSLHPNTVIIVTDLVNGRHVIGKLDNSVTSITPEQLDAMIAGGNWLFENDG